MSRLSECPECGGRLRPRQTGFLSCEDCGKLVIPPAPENAPVATAGESDLAVEVPDFTEVMVGYRAWGIEMDRSPGELPLLRSVTYRQHFWTPREANAATCARGDDDDDHEVPEEGCSCGLYAAKTFEHLQAMDYHTYDVECGRLVVCGEVSLWGKVVPGTQGWRAQFGYPRKLFVPFEAWALATPLAEAYGCEVELKNTLGPSITQEV